MMKEIYESARKFIYQNARPIDLYRWNFHFENGSKEDVMKALSVYQNEDGGFGHGLEADCWNPASSPIQTWAATEIIKEIEWEDYKHPVIIGMLRYLESGKDFKEGKWFNQIESNKDHPHAIWWEFNEESPKKNASNFNPTISLAGFIIKYAEPGSWIYDLAVRIANTAVETYLAGGLIDDMHIVSCYIQFMEYCIEAKQTHLVDIEGLKMQLINQVNHCITHNTEEWSGNYICKPSQFFNNVDSIFYEMNQSIAHYEIDFIAKTQLSDGSWEVPWQWYTDYPKEWDISQNWWKSTIALSNVRYLKGLRGETCSSNT